MHYFPTTYFGSYLWYTAPAPAPVTLDLRVQTKYHAVISGCWVRLAGIATDSVEEDISSFITWTSDLDGTLGVGREIRYRLSTGTHTITASVADSSGTMHTESWELQVKVYMNFTFDNSVDLWLDVRQATLSPAYRNYLRGLSPQNRVSAMRQRGCCQLDNLCL